MNAMTDDDRIAAMAYVDGELAGAERAAFDARLVHEPALATAVARERALRATLQSAYAPVLDEPVPGRLLDLLAMPGPQAATPPAAAANDAVAIGGNDAYRAKLPHARRWQWPEWAAMAACLVLGVLFGMRALAPSAVPSAGGTLALATGANGTITAQGPLREALEQRIGGGGDKTLSDVAVGLSFRDRAQQYCRTFSLAGASSGIACKQDDGWVVASLSHDATASSTPVAAGNYRTAASPYSPALLQAVDALRVGDTLDAVAESAARAKGWKP
jgi:hypothetical protein